MGYGLLKAIKLNSKMKYKRSINESCPELKEELELEIFEYTDGRLPDSASLVENLISYHYC